MPDQIQLTEEAMAILNALDNSKSLPYLSKLKSQEEGEPEQGADLHREDGTEVRSKQQHGRAAELRAALWEGLSKEGLMAIGMVGVAPEGQDDSAGGAKVREPRRPR